MEFRRPPGLAFCGEPVRYRKFRMAARAPSEQFSFASNFHGMTQTTKIAFWPMGLHLTLSLHFCFLACEFSYQICLQ